MVKLAMPILAFLLAATAAEFSLAASGAVHQSVVCNMSEEELVACKPAISGTVTKPAAKPTDACCAALAHADLGCLCSYKNSGLLPYLGIDPNLAMQLPQKCSITPPAKC